MSWELKPLSEILILSGLDRAGDDDFPVLSITMKNGLVDQEEKFKKRIASQDTKNYRVVYENELVVGFPIDEGVLGFQTKYLAAIVSPAYDIWKLRHHSNLHIPYMEIFLRSKWARHLYASKMQGAVARRRSLKKEDFLALKIPFPPIVEQIRIALILNQVDALIQTRRQNMEQLDDFIKSTFLNMFSDPVKNRDGWEVVNLNELIEIQSGQVHPKEEPYSEMYHVGGANIESGTGRLVNLKIAKEEKLISGKYLFTDEYVLYSKIRPYLNKVALPDFTGICSADIYPIKPKAGILTKHYLKYLLMSRYFLAYTASHSGRANIPKINRKALNAFKTRRVPVELQEKFSVIASKLESIKDKYQQNLYELENLYGALSQKAFKGELDLSRVPLPDMTESIVYERKLTDQIPVSDEVHAVEYPMSIPEERIKLLRSFFDGYLKQQKGNNLSLDNFWKEASFKTIDLMDEFDKPWGVDDYDQVKQWIFDLVREDKLSQSFVMSTDSPPDGQIELKIKG